MRLTDLIGMVFLNLWRRKLRTALTVLAVVIGATLIALMVSLGSGIESFIVDQFGLLVAEDSIAVSSGGDIFGQQGGHPVEIDSTEARIIEPFAKEDLDQIRSIEGVEQVDFIINIDALYISPQSSEKIYTVFVDTGPDYSLKIRQLVAGGYFDEGATGECLIAYGYLDTFDWTDAESALGRQVTITMGKQVPFDPQTRDYTLTVVGVLERTLSEAEVLVPMADAKEMARFHNDTPLLYTEEQPGFFLQVKAADVSLVDRVAEDIEALGFEAITSQEILNQIENVFGIIQIGLSAFGIIALVVASIGIINTLIMAIYERTREIGVMKAMGATRGTIRLLFAVEGGALGLLGGIIGGVVALVFGQLLNVIGSRTFLSDFPGFQLSVFSPWLILGVIALTTAISLLAGLYPANRAARLDPVSALRHE